jgi:hypothetical protein
MRNDAPRRAGVRENAGMADYRAVHAQIAAWRRVLRLAGTLMAKAAAAKRPAHASFHPVVSETAVELGPALALTCPWLVIARSSTCQIEAWPLVF